jgi:hypothetical protein
MRLAEAAGISTFGFKLGETRAQTRIHNASDQASLIPVEQTQYSASTAQLYIDARRYASTMRRMNSALRE